VGLVGAPILFLSAMAILFGAYDQVSSWSALTALPIAAWEFSLGVWLVFKGFTLAPVVVTDPAVVDLDSVVVPAGV
jgi:hypothetical protein